MQKSHWVILFIVFLIGSLIGYAVGYDVRAKFTLQEAWPEAQLTDNENERILAFTAKVQGVEFAWGYFHVGLWLGPKGLTEYKDFIWEAPVITSKSKPEEELTDIAIRLENAPYYPIPGKRIQVTIDRSDTGRVIVVARQNGFFWRWISQMP